MGREKSVRIEDEDPPSPSLRRGMPGFVPTKRQNFAEASERRSKRRRGSGRAVKTSDTP